MRAGLRTVAGIGVDIAVGVWNGVCGAGADALVRPSCITLRMAIKLRWGSALLGIAVAAWMLAKCWTFVPPLFSFPHATSSPSHPQGVFYLKIPAVTSAALVW